MLPREAQPGCRLKLRDGATSVPAVLGSIHYSGLLWSAIQMILPGALELPGRMAHEMESICARALGVLHLILNISLLNALRAERAKPASAVSAPGLFRQAAGKNAILDQSSGALAQFIFFGGERHREPTWNVRSTAATISQEGPPHLTLFGWHGAHGPLVRPSAKANAKSKAKLCRPRPTDLSRFVLSRFALVSRA